MRMLKTLSAIKLILCALIICCISCDDAGDLEKPSVPSSDRQVYIQLEQQLKNDLRLANAANAASIYTNSPEQRTAFERQYNRTSYYMQYGYTSEQVSPGEARDLVASSVGETVTTPVTGGGNPSDPIKSVDALRLIDNNILKPVQPVVTLSPGQVQGIEDIGAIVDGSSSYEDCIAALSVRFDEVYSNNTLSVEDRNYMLVYITTFKAVLAYADETFAADPSQVGGRVQGWWSSWGKCVAGILGGGITGAVSGGLAGAAIGTITVPGIGTVSAGAVGAIAGGVGGVLTGAAASCGNMTKAGTECTFDLSSNKPTTFSKACFSTVPLTITSIAPGVTTLRPVSVLLKL